MSLRPYYKRFASDFIAGVSGMTSEQIGVYTILLDTMYARRRKLETDTPKAIQGLARACGSTTRRFNQVLGELLAMPNKITRDAEGRLSNPKFERLLAAETPQPAQANDAQQSTSDGGGPELSPLFDEINPRKNPDNLEIIHGENQATLFENKDLDPVEVFPTRARARSIVHSPERTSVTTGGSAAPGSGAAEHMDPAGFQTWVTACAKTIPRGWSEPAALKQWLKLPRIDTGVMVEAWHAYVDHNREQSKGHRFKQKTRYPESWMKDRVYESFLQAIELRQESERTAAAALAARQQARNTTITAWGEFGTIVLQQIGLDKFGQHLTGTTNTKTDAGTFEIDFFANDRARGDANQNLWSPLEKALGGKVFFTSNRTRTNDAAFAAKRQKPPP